MLLNNSIFISSAWLQNLSRYLSFLFSYVVANCIRALRCFFLFRRGVFLARCLRSPSLRSVLATVCRVTLTPMDTIYSTNSSLDVMGSFCFTILFSIAIHILITNFTGLTGTLNCSEIFQHLIPASYSFTILFQSWRERSVTHSVGLEESLLAAWLWHNDCPQHWLHIVSSITCSRIILKHFELQDVRQLSYKIQIGRCYLYATNTFLHHFCKLIARIWKCIFSSISLRYLAFKMDEFLYLSNVLMHS